MEKPQATNTTTITNSNINNKQRKKKKASDPNTLFVKFTPPSPYITRHHLSNYFSNWGPVNKCSVIRNKSAGGGNNKAQEEGDGGDKQETENQDRGTKGYGFIRFVNVDDAISAATAIKEQNSSQLKMGMTVDGILYKIHAERAVDAAAVNNNNVQKKERSSKDTDKKKEEINKVTPPPPSNNKSTTPTLTKEEEQTKYKTESKRKRTSRVIIRNLSFYANQSNITQVMEDLFGPVSVVDLPLVPNNNNTTNNNTSRGALTRHRGFAFVTFTNLNAAKMAVEYDKEIRIKNRVVAVDFSISKVEHQRLLREEKDGKNKEESSSDGSSSDSDNESGSEEEGSDGEESNGDDDSSDDDSSSSSEEESDSESDSEDEKKDSDDDKKNLEQDTEEEDKPPPEDQFTTSNESKRTLFLRNIPFDATRHDIFELFRKFGRIEGVYLVKDKVTGVFKGTAFVRFENEEGCMNAMDEATGGGGDNGDGTSQFVSSKNMTMSGESESSSLTLKGRTILLDLAVDRTTASSLAIQRDEDGKPIKKMVGKDKRNLYLKNEGRVSSSTDSGHAQEASAKHGGLWEGLPMSDRAKRERAFADKSTKLRSPLFFINPNRISIRNLNKEVNESQLKSLGKFLFYCSMNILTFDAQTANIISSQPTTPLIVTQYLVH